MMNRGSIGIEEVVYELPGEPISILDWTREQNLGALLPQLEKSGCASLYRSENHSPLELARKALAKLIGRDATALGADLMLFAHALPMSALLVPQSLPGRLAAEFGLKRALAFSVAQQNCSSLSAAIQVATKWLESDPRLKSAVVISSDVVAIEASRTRQPGGIQSDGASALLLTKGCRKNRIGGFMSRHIPGIVSATDIHADSLGKLRALEQISLFQMLREQTQSLRASGSHPQRIVHSHLNRAGWEALCSRLDLASASLAQIPRFGHVSASDLAISLAESRAHELAAGEVTLVLSQSNIGVYRAFSLQGAEA